jgi:hypothetical protein
MNILKSNELDRPFAIRFLSSVLCQLSSALRWRRRDAQRVHTPQKPSAASQANCSNIDSSNLGGLWAQGVVPPSLQAAHDEVVASARIRSREIADHYLREKELRDRAQFDERDRA